MIFHGLIRYGFDQAAQELALDLNPVTREYYNSETGQGYGMNPFWGWSSLAYLMPLEYELHYDPTDLTSAIRPIAKDRLGLSFPLAGSH